MKVGLVQRDGIIREFECFPTPRDIAGNLDVQKLSGSVGRMLQRNASRIERIGVGVPGLLNECRDTVILALNLGLRQVRLASMLEKSWGLPVTLDSDVVMGAVGEKQFGAARGLDRFLYISIGTGISACLVEENGILRNQFGGPLNIGHMSVDPNGVPCPCGNRGCLERYVSARGIAEQAARRLPPDQAGGAGEGRSDVETVVQWADRGCEVCRDILRQAVSSLSHAIVNLINIFGWYPVVVGGGLSRLETYFVQQTLHEVRQKLDARLSGRIDMRAAAYPSQSGVLGAAFRSCTG